MNPFADSALAGTLAPAAVALVIKATLVLLAAALVDAALRRRASAAARHQIWTLATICVLALPVLSLALPSWPVVPLLTVPAAPAAAPGPSVPPLERGAMLPSSPAAGPPAARVPGDDESLTAGRGPNEGPWIGLLLMVYTVGLTVMLARLAAQHWQARRFVARSAVVEDADWCALFEECRDRVAAGRAVRFLRSREHNVPMAVGVLAPAVIIPRIADSWDPPRRRAVVLHELAHVVRRDALTHALACVARALYWFHPLAWIAVARVRVERELACDDRVLAAGTAAREYAGHLLEIAHSLSGDRAPALAVSMASPRQLEGRLLAALDDGRNRRPPARRVRFAVTLGVAALLVPVASAVPALSAADPVPAGGIGIEAGLPDGPGRTVGPTLKRIDWFAAFRDVLGLSSIAEIAQELRGPGTWEIRPSKTAGAVRLRLVEADSSSETSVPLDRFEGLTAAQLASGSGPITFRLRRDAGTFAFEGVMRGGVGAGTFTFAADGKFAAELARRGFERPTAAQQYQLARHDVGYGFLDELAAQSYGRPPVAELVRAGQHGVNQAYLREMGALGYRLGTLPPLIELRDHGVTPEYVRELAALGYASLPAEQVRRARDHGVTPEYIRGLKDAGYDGLAIDALITTRDHGVNPEYVAALRAAGYDKLPIDEVVRTRDHGVSAEYIQQMKQLGHAPRLDALVKARDHGVTPEFVRELTAAGYSGLSLDALVRLRDHGVSPKYVRDLDALGYKKIPAEDLIMLRSHGLTAERIKAANDRAGSPLPLDLLKSIATGRFD